MNGIAFAGGFMAVSTRCEVVFHDLDPRSSEAGPYIYNGGAHDVLATSSGGFVAPLGVYGLLRVPKIGKTEIKFSVNTIRDHRINIYQLALLHGDGTRDFIAAAARGDGICTFDLNSKINNGRPNNSVYFKVPGLDVVSLCSLNSSDWPYSLAALGADGSVHLFRDVQAQQKPLSFRLDDMLGSPYTILHSKGHLFILTGQALYSCPNLATRFLDEKLGNGLERVNRAGLRAVDVYSVDGEILIEMADCLIVVQADELALLEDSSNLGLSNGSKLESINDLWTIASEQIAVA